VKDPASTWNSTVVLRIMEKQRTADRLALCEQMDLEARVAEIAVVAALADRAHRSAIVVELARTLLNMPASSAVRIAGVAVRAHRHDRMVDLERSDHAVSGRSGRLILVNGACGEPCGGAHQSCERWHAPQRTSDAAPVP
jgi:hypothetical protein